MGNLVSRDAHTLDTTHNPTRDSLLSHDTAEGRDSTSKTTNGTGTCVLAAKEDNGTRKAMSGEARHSPSSLAPSPLNWHLPAEAVRAPIDLLRAVSHIAPAEAAAAATVVKIKTRHLPAE